ncbi:MAG: transcription elongation factor GreB [Myxococcaceae bacterium]|nr:transcription elongation factor GreB [Myxococcaceae bacterium]
MGRRADDEEVEGGEEEGALLEEAAEEEDTKPRGTLYITPSGAERLRAELRQLLTVERPKVTAEVSAAAALGDRSENAEYIYGKRRLREIDRRLRFLQKRLEALTIVDPKEQKEPGRIFFGATVTLQNDEDESKVTYQLVGPDETELKTGRISVDSPVARALIGKKKGDTVTVMRPKGEAEFTILNIRYV